MSTLKAKSPVLLTPLNKATRFIKINFTEWGQENRLYIFLHEVGRKYCVRFVPFFKFYALIKVQFNCHCIIETLQCSYGAIASSGPVPPRFRGFNYTLSYLL